MIVYKVWSLAPEEAHWEKLDLKNSKEIIKELSDAAHFECGEETIDGVPILDYYRTKAQAMKEYRRLLKNKSDPVDAEIRIGQQIIDDQYEDDEDEDEDDKEIKWRK